MQKDASYHQSAIQYNEELAVYAEDLSKRLEHPEVSRWSASVAKQHRFHEGRHRKALAKMESDQNVKVVETEDGGEDRVNDGQVLETEETPSAAVVFQAAEPVKEA